MYKQISIPIAVIAALVLTVGAIASNPAIAEICTPQGGNSVSCFIESGSVVVEKVGGAEVTVTETSNETLVEVEQGPVVENVTETELAPVIDPCAPETHVVDNSTLQCGVPTPEPSPEQPEAAEEMIVPEESVDEMIVD